MRSVEESQSMTGNSPASSAIDFPTLCHRLKITKLKGWINHGIKGPESIADHMYRWEKSPTTTALIGDSIPSEEIKELWTEYENNASLDANLVKYFDKVEMILQALEYGMEHGKVLDEFFFSKAGKFQTVIGKSWAAEISSRRKSILARMQN